MKTVSFHTLGCKLNFTESGTIARQFVSNGFSVVPFEGPADVVVLNTCSVTERADRECRQLVRKALRTSPKAYVIVVGCYAQLRPDVLESIDGIDLILGTREKFDVFRHADWVKKQAAHVRVSHIADAVEAHLSSSAGFSDRTRAFLKIQDGCDYTCTFCTIPLARGGSRSVARDTILREAESLVQQGFREIVLTGVNVGDYGRRQGSTLAALVKDLVAISGLDRIRISSVEPNLLSDELLDVWVNSEKVCRHFHIPLQSGSNQVLRSMQRRYQREWYAGRLAVIDAALPDSGKGADVIVGFPGESDRHFEETYEFLADHSLTYLHVFAYSERPNTPAASGDKRVPANVRAARSERLRSLSRRKRRIFHESLVGKTVDVLFEESGPAEATGLSSEYVRVTVPSPGPVRNEIHKVRIISAGDEECAGVLAEHVGMHKSVGVPGYA